MIPASRYAAGPVTARRTSHESIAHSRCAVRRLGAHDSAFASANCGAAPNVCFDHNDRADTRRAAFHDLILKHKRHIAHGCRRLPDDNHVGEHNDHTRQLPYPSWGRPTVLLPQCADDNGRRH